MKPALQVQNRGLKQHLLHFISFPSTKACMQDNNFMYPYPQPGNYCLSLIAMHVSQNNSATSSTNINNTHALTKTTRALAASNKALIKTSIPALDYCMRLLAGKKNINSVEDRFSPLSRVLIMKSF